MTKASVDPERLEIRRLEVGDESLVAGFESGDGDLNDFLRDDALRLQSLNTVLTYVALYDGVVEGYVSLMVDAIVLETKERKKLLLTHDDHPVVPALKVARLACGKAFREAHFGLGRMLMLFALSKAITISDSVACRLITVDAYPGAVSFYDDLKFVRNRAAPYKGKEHPSMRFDMHAPVLPDWAKGLSQPA